ncbi:hypothetical protein Glove_40g178 [Diversispora epigaea]|uniref:TLDc domain-containing protein n=1 Tax=Diversispora epigaea TaxID=1348612 RepID=A0A397JK21_9GLOM|nr:hypothetical protein Glove_40g178 [Diversispora epigaea]
MPYRFQLILRGNRDGFAPKTFWDMCHGYTNMIAILKVEGTEILGGYNPLQWNKYYNFEFAWEASWTTVEKISIIDYEIFQIVKK